MTGVIWVRVSSVEQAKGYSPDAQLRELKEAAERRSIEIVKTFQAAESAKVSSARKQFKELIAFIEAEKPDILVTLAIDRLTRNPEDLHALHGLIEKGLKVFVVNQGKIISKASSPSDKFTFLLFGNIAYLDNMQRGERTKMGMLEKARRGVLPSRCPVGYKNEIDTSDPDGRRKTVVVDSIKGPLVKLAFELYAKGGYSLATLRDELNRKGLRQKLTSKNPNAPMSVHGLEVILNNPFYIGEVRWDKQTFKGTHEPLVSTELFERVKSRLSENRRYARPSAKKHFAFKPFLKCGYCHTAMTAEEQSGRHGKGHFIYYHCSHSRNKHCQLGNFREEKIDAMFAEALGDLYIDEEIADKIKEQLKKSHVEQKASDKKELQRLRAAETQKKNHLDILYQDRLDGTITKEHYLEKQASIQQDLRSIRADIEILGRINLKYKEEGEIIVDLIRDFKKIYMAADIGRKVEILNVLIDRAVIRGGELHVFWKEPFAALALLGEGVLTSQSWQRYGDSNPGLMAENHLS